MLRAGCDVARQKVSKVAGTCILQLAMPESTEAGKMSGENHFKSSMDLCKSIYLI